MVVAAAAAAAAGYLDGATGALAKHDGLGSDAGRVEQVADLLVVDLEEADREAGGRAPRLVARGRFLEELLDGARDDALRHMVPSHGRWQFEASNSIGHFLSIIDLIKNT